jgi:ABC-type nitrate/sulfonate/bicarbonate transport system substrate-binding protein
MPGLRKVKQAGFSKFPATTDEFLEFMQMQKSSISTTAIAGVLVALLSAHDSGWAQALDKVSFGTAWVAEAAHGGFYQAVADGTYRKHGLDVTIVQGGPLVNNQLLLSVGRLDFAQSDTLQSFDAVAQNIPTLAIAAMFQKDPQVMIALADSGFNGYSNLIQTRREMVDTKADIAQRFVDASIIGWNNYLYGDNRAANDLIKGDNPQMSDDQLAHSVATMKEYGIVDSGEAKELGIGAMTDPHIASFFDKMVKAGVVKADLDYRKAYTLRFVNKKVGMDLRRN